MKSFPLRPGLLAAIVALAALILAVSVGLVYGIALSVLLLATCALGLVIALLWSSVRNLTGDTPLTLDEALGLGAPSPEEEQKRAVLRALKDLEYERSVGKISEGDYRDYSARYREEARRLMERVDASLAEARELAEKLVDERVAAAGLAGAQGDDLRQAKAETASTVAETEAPASDDDDDDDDTSNEPDSDDDEADETEDEAGETDDKAVSNEANGKSGSTLDCPACTRANDADAKFCKHCGAVLEGGTRAARSKREREEKTP